MTPEEAALLRGLPQLAVVLYAVGLRPRADEMGVVTGVTWAQLCADGAVLPRPGVERVAPTRQAAQRAVDWLVRAGLVVSVGDAFTLQFDLPLVNPGREAGRPSASNGAASSDSAGRKAGRAEPKAGQEAGRAKASCYAGFSGIPGREVGRPEQGVESGLVSPASPPLSSPLINPPTYPPAPPPSPTFPARELPAFTLEAPPSGPPPAPAPVEAEARGRIPEHWTPTPATMLALRQKGLEPDEARAEIGTFVTYWSAARGQEAMKRASGWQLAFIRWCGRIIARKEKRPPNEAAEKSMGTTGGPQYVRPDPGGQSRRPSASERNAAAIRQHFAREADADPADG